MSTGERHVSGVLFRRNNTVAPCNIEGAERQHSYPPYPDKWIWLPTDVIAGRGTTTLHPMPNGDVLISYRVDDESAQSIATSFFSATSYPSVEAAFGGKYPPAAAQRRIEFRDGVVVHSIVTDACSRGLGSAIVVKGAKR